MRSKRVLGTSGVCLALVVGLVLKTGCDSGVGFLGLQDYQRDLLLGGLAAAVLAGNQGDGDGGTGNPIPDVDGLVGPPGEQGLPGADGTSGVDGADGAVGPAGSAGPAGEQGAQGPVGSAGATGSAGSNGAQGADGVPGPDSLFSLFIDDFFAADATQNGNLPIELVAVAEPALAGWIDRAEPPVEVVDAVAFRVGIPQKYQGGDVTMRLYFHRMFEPDGDCFAFTVDGRRLRAGVGIDFYDGERRWVRVEENNKDQARQQTAAEALLGETTTGRTIVIDLPINSSAGLGFPGDLASADFLGFELATYVNNYAMYHLLGVEFFESPAGTAQTVGATIYSEESWQGNDAICGGCVTACHEDIVTTCDSGQGAVVAYDLPVIDECFECPEPGEPTLFSVTSSDGFLRTIDSDTAATMDSVAITMDGYCVWGGTGLATDSGTNELWALLKAGAREDCVDETRSVFVGCTVFTESDRGIGDTGCASLSDDSEACANAYQQSPSGVESCHFDPQLQQCGTCTSIPRGEGEICINTCVVAPDCADETRTIFLGGPNTGACHVFDGDPESCNQAYALGGSGVHSCFYSEGEGCRGCGPNNDGEVCENVCRGESACPGDDSITEQVDSCRNLDAQGACDISFQLGEDGVTSCWWNADAEQCRGCGSNNECNGFCDNACRVGPSQAEARGRHLVMIDEATGVATQVGNTGIPLAGLAFTADGTLYAISGDGACPSETLFTLSTADGSATELCHLGDGDDGEAIGFNPVDGMVYHASGHYYACDGQEEGVCFESIDTTDGDQCGTSSIDISETDLIDEEAQALTYSLARGAFLWKQNHGDGPLFAVTADGEVTLIGDMDHQAKGLAFVEDDECVVYCEPASGSVFGVGDTQVSCWALGGDVPQRGEEPGCTFTVTVESGEACLIDE